jgi:hypothetical protein
MVNRNEIVSMVAEAEKESAKKIYATLWQVSVPERGQDMVEKLEKEGEQK